VTWLSDAAVERLRDVADWPVVPGGRYEILAALARGGMGMVYRGRDLELGRDVAIKVLSAATIDRSAALRMQQEARVLATLEHPGIVPIYDVGLLEDGRLFYVMKLVQGPRLDEHAIERPLVDRLRLFTRICDAVAFAHSQGIVHRDLKPENVMVGSFGEVLVMDWGVAQFVTDDAGMAVVGTRGYMAPEQARGQNVDCRADVYGLGGLLQFLLTGASPDQRPLRGPRPVQAICRKARSEALCERYGDVPSLAADVDRFLAGEPVTAAPEDTVDRIARFVRKHRAAILMVAAYLILRVVMAWLAP
jgi:eukaryotic-like serine/threonine-protein kinase